MAGNPIREDGVLWTLEKRRNRPFEADLFIRRKGGKGVWKKVNCIRVAG